MNHTMRVIIITIKFMILIYAPCYSIVLYSQNTFMILSFTLQNTRLYRFEICI